MGGARLVKYPIVYSEEETNFFHLGLGPLTTSLTATVTEEKNGSFFFEGEIALTPEVQQLVKNNQFIKADAGHKLKNQLFRIKRLVNDHSGKMKIYAEHVSYLSAELALQPEMTLHSRTGQQALETWKNGIIGSHPFRVSSDIESQHSTTWRIDKVQNARQALGGVEGSLLDVWGGEYLFDNYHIQLLKKRGTTADTVLAYGRNITDLEQEKNITETYTSVYPFAITKDSDEREQIVTIDGYIVDASNWREFPNRKVLAVDFSSSFETEETVTKDKLRKFAEKYIRDNKIGHPKTSIKVSFLDLSKTADYKSIAPLEEVSLCDDVRVIYPKLGVNTIAKVVRTVWNVLTESYDEIEIGEKRASLSSVLKEQQVAIKEAVNQAGVALSSADGKTTVFHGLFGENGLGEPKAQKINDVWFKPNGDEIDMYLWNGTVWQEKLSSSKRKELERTLSNQQTELENTKRQITEADKKSQQAITEAGFAKNGLTAMQGHLTEIQTKATQALAESTKMKEEVGRAKESTTNISREVDRVKGQLAQKVSQTEINAFRNRLESMNTLMSQTAQGLSAKADKTAIDVLNRTVQSYQSSLTIQNNSIQSVVSKTNGVKTKLSSLEQKQTGFQQTVLNQLNGVTTQQTQLADQITSVIEKVSDGKPNLFHQTKADLLRSSDLSRYKVVAGAPVTLFENYGNQVLRFKGGAGVWLTKTENIKLTDSKPISFSVKTKNTGIYRLKVSIVYYNNKTENFEQSFTVSGLKETILRYENIRFKKFTKEVTLGINFLPQAGLDAYIEWMKLEIGPECTPWRPAVDEEFTYEERSKITQSLDRINLAVQKGDLISQINIEAGKTLIQSKKILLDAETVVFKGSAFIPKAVIKDFVVDTAEIRGTLDASRIRVINMDAGNLSTGYLNGNRIRANSITADKLATNAIQVGFNSYSDNLKLNPSSMDFYGGTKLKGKFTSEGMEFWYGSRKIGRIGESSKLGNDDVRGISMALENSGDYVTWSYRKNSTDSALTTMLTLDPKGRFSGKSGIHIDSDVHMIRVKPRYDGAKEFLKFDIVKYNNYNYSGLLNDSGKTGIFMGGNWLYFLHDNHVILMEDIKKVIYTLKGLGSVSIPKSINSDGKVARWTTLTL